MKALEYIFWASGFLVFYAYAGYALLLLLLSLLIRKKGPGAGEHAPEVTLVISAYNEASVIEEKILNSLSLDYPRRSLEIVVVSDGSTDATAEIARRYAKDGVVLRHYEGRIGKTACLNLAVPLARGEVVIFSDANSRYSPDAARRLVSHFSSPEIGFVTGHTRYSSKKGGVASIGVYSRLEKLTKSLEGRIGSCVGADGAIFAARKSLVRKLGRSDINDFVIPLDIVRQGYRGVLDDGAFCTEDTAGGGEFRRQVRITNRTLRAIFANSDLLNPLRHGLFSFELFSHKVCKLLVPFSLALLLASSAALAPAGAFYAAALGAQAAFYAMAALIALSGAPERFPGLFSFAHTFTTANMAIFYGWMKYLKGEDYVTWSPTQR